MDIQGSRTIKSLLERVRLSIFQKDYIISWENTFATNRIQYKKRKEKL